MNFRWTLQPPQPLLTERLANASNVSTLLAQCLVNRGLSDAAAAQSFLAPRLKQLADPFLLPDMHVAVERLLRARAANEPLVIFGDYDVDGVSSTALLLEVFGRLGIETHAYLPHRMDEGYGLTREAVENCLKKYPAKLLLAVDCGSTACETVAWLRKHGVEVIVLDHHQVSDPPPTAIALVNPRVRISISKSPTANSFMELCSVGLAFKLAHALIKRSRQLEVAGAMEFDLRPLLDLVALGTVADLVPLTGENRVLVSAGLKRLSVTQRPGLIALKQVARTAEPIGVYEVAFQLAPRLNAAGRLENAERALQLLRARDFAEAEPIAHELDAQNRERQQIERTIVEEVTGSLRARFNAERDFVIVEGQLLWHIGVVGIVASRVLREFYRPTLIIGGEGEVWRGSGRSIDGFDLAAALRHCDDLLLRHGGHAMAAGLSIHPSKLDQLRDRLNEFARRALTADQLCPSLRLDQETALGDLTLERVIELESIGPFGQGNPPIHLVARNLQHARAPQPLGKNNQHLKLQVTDGSATHEAVWWNCADKAPMEAPFDLAFSPQINEFNGRRTLQLKVLDWKPSEHR